MDRRSFLSSSVAALAAGASAQALPLAAAPSAERRRGLPFKPLAPTGEDALRVAPGFRADIVASYGDKIGQRKKQKLTFGYNCDYVTYLPIDALADGKDSSHGLLLVNHEYPSAFQHGEAKPDKKSKEQVELEMRSLGCAVFEVKRRDGRWRVVEGSRFARRYDAFTEIDFTGPAKGQKEVGGRKVARGTFANCSGGTTPWHTVTTCEENVQNMYGWSGGVPEDERYGYGWHRHFPGVSTDYGWVVEIDPFGEFEPKKRTALGRFSHENCAFATSPDGRLVAYMGDDAKDECVYKFVSKDPLSGDRKQNHDHALSEGTLYVANFKKGEWIALDFASDEDEWRKRGFQSQADILVRTREAAKAAGGTPTDRPEDLEVHPHRRGEVYVAWTNNDEHGNVFGQIGQIVEDDRDPASLSFTWHIAAVGGQGPEAFACPDNLTFDRHGQLWVATDISSSAVGRGVHERRGNNAFFLVDDEGRGHRFIEAPVGAELTGPAFTPDETTLFLSVQHPGENSKWRAGMPFDSCWPGEPGDAPLPSLIAVQRESGGAVTGTNRSDSRRQGGGRAGSRG